MSQAYHEGGWGMYPTTILGILLLLAAVLYAIRPDRRGVLTVICLGAVTFLSGCLGFVTGAIRTLAVASSGEFPEPVGTVTAAGISESLNNIALALLLLVLASIITTVGVLRSGN